MFFFRVFKGDDEFRIVFSRFGLFDCSERYWIVLKM